jgi:hypothetical protein
VTSRNGVSGLTSHNVGTEHGAAGPAGGERSDRPQTLWGKALTVAPYVVITIATLIVVDLLCNLFGLFPPVPEYGDLDVGWLAAKRTANIRYDRCAQLSGELVQYVRNEDGIRTNVSVQQLLADRRSFKVGVTGDSQTELCAPNAQTHAGRLERELNASGVRAIVLPYGVGRYSPLQSYLVFKKMLKKFAPDALLLNFYTGNDFNDLLRVDDRPHFVNSDGRYVIAEPVWYRLEDPRVRRRSRVLFVLRSLTDKTGIRDLVLRFRFLYRTAVEQGAGVGAVLGYMNDLRKSVEPSVTYPEAFTAQFLNQQLFFHRFPGTRDESVRRVRALLELARRENPNTLLIVSALPSYELVQQRPVDAALMRTLDRLPITYDGGVREEQELYDTLRQVAAESGWLFVDNLRALRAYQGRDRLYNAFDYHLLPAASAIIGKTQAAVLLAYLRSHGRASGPPQQVTNAIGR